MDITLSQSVAEIVAEDAAKARLTVDQYVERAIRGAHLVMRDVPARGKATVRRSKAGHAKSGHAKANTRRYVSWQAQRNYWAVRIHGKYIGSSKDISVAIAIRDKYLLTMQQ